MYKKHLIPKTNNDNPLKYKIKNGTYDTEKLGETHA